MNISYYILPVVSFVVAYFQTVMASAVAWVLPVKADLALAWAGTLLIQTWEEHFLLAAVVDSYLVVLASDFLPMYHLKLYLNWSQ